MHIKQDQYAISKKLLWHDSPSARQWRKSVPKSRGGGGGWLQSGTEISSANTHTHVHTKNTYIHTHMYTQKKHTHTLHIQWKLSITRSLGPRQFVLYIRYFVISVVNKQYKTKEINSLGPEKLVCYIRYFVISDLFISSFHCTCTTHVKTFLFLFW